MALKQNVKIFIKLALYEKKQPVGCFFLRFLAFFFDSGRLGGKSADIAEMRSPDFSLTNYLDLVDNRRMQWECTFDTDTVGNFPYCESFADSAALLFDA